MYGFLLRPRWLAFHAIVLTAIILMVNLGLWQLRRLDERQEFNRTVIERTEEPPVPVTQLIADGYDPETDEWTPVTMSGTYLPDQILQFNVSQGGRAGEGDVLDPAADAAERTDTAARAADAARRWRGLRPWPVLHRRSPATNHLPRHSRHHPRAPRAAGRPRFRRTSLRHPRAGLPTCSPKDRRGRPKKPI